MPLLKDTEREQLRQLVKACLLEISKLKIELKKCQKESSNSVDSENILIKTAKEECQTKINHKNHIRLFFFPYKEIIRLDISV